MKLLRSGDAPRGALDELQTSIAAHKQRVVETVRAPLPAEEVTQRVRDLIAREVERINPVRAVSHIRYPGPVQLPILSWGMWAWLWPGEAERALVARLSEMEPAAGLPEARRGEAIATLRRELQELERREELEIQRLEAEGYIVLRRPAADLQLLLNIWAGC